MKNLKLAQYYVCFLVLIMFILSCGSSQVTSTAPPPNNVLWKTAGFTPDKIIKLALSKDRLLNSKVSLGNDIVFVAQEAHKKVEGKHLYQESEIILVKGSVGIINKVSYDNNSYPSSVNVSFPVSDGGVVNLIFSLPKNPRVSHVFLKKNDVSPALLSQFQSGGGYVDPQGYLRIKCNNSIDCYYQRRSDGVIAYVASENIQDLQQYFLHKTEAITVNNKQYKTKTSAKLDKLKYRVQKESTTVATPERW